MFIERRTNAYLSSECLALYFVLGVLFVEKALGFVFFWGLGFGTQLAGKQTKDTF